MLRDTPPSPAMRHVLLLLALALPSATGCAGSRAAAGHTAVAPLAPGLTLHLTTAPFDASRYEVVTDETGYVLGTVGCDTWHGDDGGVPPVVLVAAWVVRDGQRLDLDTSCMGIYDSEGRDEPFGAFEATALDEPGTWRIDGSFSDGAGSGEVTWTVGRTATTRDRLVSGPELEP